MATIASLLVKIEANTSGLKKAITSSQKAVARFSKRSQKDLKKVSNGFNLGKQAARGFRNEIAKVISVAAGLRAVVGVFQKGREFSGALADLSAITGATGADLEFLTEASKEFGITTTLSATQAARAFKLVASAKPDLLKNVVALKAVTKEAITLSEATGQDLPSSAKALGSALNQFGAGSNQANKFINVLAAGAKLGASEVADTAEALKASGVIASQAGLSFEELNASIQTLAKVGIKGGDAGTALRNILLILTTQTKQHLNPEIVGINKALENLSREGLDAAGMLKLFDRRSLSAARTLIKYRGELSQLTKGLTGTNIAQEQAEIKAKSFDGKMKTLNSSIEGFALALFDNAKPALTSLVEGFTDAARWATKNADKIVEVAKVFAAGSAFVAALGVTLLAVKGVTSAIALLYANPIILGIGTVAAAILAIATNWDKVTESVGKAIKAIGDAIKALGKLSIKNPFAEQVEAIKKRQAGQPAAEPLLTAQQKQQEAIARIQRQAGQGGGIGVITDPETGRTLGAGQRKPAGFGSISDPFTSRTSTIEQNMPGFGSISDPTTGRTLTTQSQKPIPIAVTITADKDGLINAVVDSPNLKEKINAEFQASTRDTARQTRR